MTGAVGRLALSARVVKEVLVRPTDVLDRLQGRRENKRQDSMRPPGGEDVLPNRADVLSAAHEVLGVSECRSCPDELLHAGEAVSGEGYEGHRLDGGQMLTRVLWALVRHLQPEHVVETGVARGISSAFVLAALERNDHGQLWSIDLPPVLDTEIEVGSAVPDSLRHRWTYIRGASRRRLPPLLEELDAVDLFIHDGLHTSETMTFELHHVWPYVRAGGVLVVDDANENRAFVSFADRVGRDPVLVAEEDKQTVVGMLRV